MNGHNPDGLDDLGMCRLAALAYGLRLINEKEKELGLPLPTVSTRTLWKMQDALVHFVLTKGDQIAYARGLPIKVVAKKNGAC